MCCTAAPWPLATYFSGPKLRWILEEHPHVAADARKGEALFGTIDAWLLWNVTPVKGVSGLSMSRSLRPIALWALVRCFLARLPALVALIPPADVQATPYGFRNPGQVYAAMDGELGAYLREEMKAKGIYGIPGGCFENGMHQLTCSSKPINVCSVLATQR